MTDKDLFQLYRRISCYVVVTEIDITVYDSGLDQNGKPQGLGQVFKNELANKKKENKPKVDFKSMFGKICENSDDGIDIFLPTAEQTKINID